MSVLIFGKRCKLCPRWISLSELPHRGDENRGYTCEACQVRHYTNLQALTEQIANNYATDYGQRCQGDNCNLSLDQIEALYGKRSMYVHQKDGVLQMLCPGCSNEYEHKANTIYHNTLYGRMKKLSGYK